MAPFCHRSRMMLNGSMPIKRKTATSKAKTKTPTAKTPGNGAGNGHSSSKRPLLALEISPSIAPRTRSPCRNSTQRFRWGMSIRVIDFSYPFHAGRCRSHPDGSRGAGSDAVCSPCATLCQRRVALLFYDRARAPVLHLSWLQNRLARIRPW